MAVRIDLRRDLPKALAMKDKLVVTAGNCVYAAPCVIGAMVPEKKRALLDCANREDTSIRRLLTDGDVKAPKHQWADIIALQGLFDGLRSQGLAQKLESLRQKYLPASVDRSGEAGETREAGLDPKDESAVPAEERADAPNPTPES